MPSPQCSWTQHLLCRQAKDPNQVTLLFLSHPRLTDLAPTAQAGRPRTLARRPRPCCSPHPGGSQTQPSPCRQAKDPGQDTQVSLDTLRLTDPTPNMQVGQGSDPTVSAHTGSHGYHWVLSPNTHTHIDWRTMCPHG